FPVSSIQGTVWVTTKELVEYWFNDSILNNNANLDESKAYAVRGVNKEEPLNLGWLLLEVKNISNEDSFFANNEVFEWVKKIVIVSENLFSYIVNDNLEVRTSVRISSETGTAVEGALFTYEAIPRGTLIGFEIGIDTSKNDITIVDDLLNTVSPYFKIMGIGGMGTKGFGRLDLVNTNNQMPNEEQKGANAND
ncbi:MAG: RAMP superfamily CRISPR-associated protein, partial [Candidatus Heimdallarchaeaceae archaeon]